MWVSGIECYIQYNIPWVPIYSQVFLFWEWYEHYFQMRNSLDVSTSGHSPWLLDWTCCLRTPLCHVYIPYKDILQGSSRLCNWVSLWCLVPWINHLPPACWSTFRKSSLNDSRFVSLTYRKTTFFWLFHIYLDTSEYDNTIFSFTLFSCLEQGFIFYIVHQNSK